MKKNLILIYALVVLAFSLVMYGIISGDKTYVFNKAYSETSGEERNKITNVDVSKSPIVVIDNITYNLAQVSHDTVNGHTIDTLKDGKNTIVLEYGADGNLLIVTLSNNKKNESYYKQ